MRDDPKLLFTTMEQRVEEEIQRSKDVLPVGSWDAVLGHTEEALFHHRSKPLAELLTPILLDAKDFKTLRAMYERLARVKDTPHLIQAVKSYFEGQARAIVSDQARDDEMIERLLVLKETADNALSQAFLAAPDAPASPSSSAVAAPKPDQKFVYAVGDAFTAGFRARRSRPAEMAARFLDKQLRRGQGALSDAAFQAALGRVLPLYRYTEDKDVFRTFYHRMLAKRLLLGKSASIDVEKWLLRELRDKYDHDFGSAEAMFTDLTKSADLMAAYRSSKDAKGADKLNVMVLTQSVWPFSREKQEVDLPIDMQDQLTAFTKFYVAQQHKGRALHWDHALGTATLRAQFKQGPKELSVSLFQALVLLLFNGEDAIAFQDIAQRTRIEDAELRRTLQSLACAKKKVLRKVPPGRDVGDADVFRFNADFADPHLRVHINTIQAKVSPEESRRTNVAIEADRVSSLEAAIVRLMKAKKELGYEQLKVATIDAVKSHFVPSVEIIKKCIDSLVEREYFVRAENDKNVFQYVA